LEEEEGTDLEEDEEKTPSRQSPFRSSSGSGPFIEVEMTYKV
jgi:hypothetical protein